MMLGVVETENRFNFILMCVDWTNSHWISSKWTGVIPIIDDEIRLVLFVI